MAKELEDYLNEPLNETTRKHRRNLLIFSLIGIVTTKANLFPKKIQALGIELDIADNEKLLIILSFVIIYFLSTFIVYFYSEFYTMYFKIISQREELQRREERERLPYYTWILFRRLRWTIFTRFLFEFTIPIGLSIYSLVLLWTTELPAVTSK